MYFPSNVKVLLIFVLVSVTSQLTNAPIRAQVKVVRELTGHKLSIVSLDFSPDGKLLASASWDKTIKIWNVATGRVVGELKGHTKGVGTVVFDREGKSVVSGSNDNTIQIWDVGSLKSKLEFKGHNDSVFCVALSPDGKTVASGSYDRTIKIWDKRNGKIRKSIQAHRKAVGSLRFSANGLFLISHGYYGAVKQWNVSTGKLINTIGNQFGACALTIIDDAKTVVTGGDSGRLCFWSLGFGGLERKVVAHEGQLYALDSSRDCALIASAGGDMCVRIWDAHTAKLKATIKEKGLFFIRAVAFSDDSKLLATVSAKDSIKIWDVSGIK